MAAANSIINTSLVIVMDWFYPIAARPWFWFPMTALLVFFAVTISRFRLEAVNSIRRTFSRNPVSDDDGKRFIDASFGLLVAFVLLALVAWAASLYTGEPEVASAGQKLWHLGGWLYLLIVLLLASTLSPFLLHQYDKLTYFWGSTCNILAFSVITTLMFLLVAWSGGIGASIYSASYMPLFAIAVFIPRDSVIRFTLCFITMVFGALLVEAADGIRQAHDSAILFLSLAAYGYGAGVRFILNTARRK